METIYAGLITVLFSAWVWDLKSQTGSVRRVQPSGRGHRPAMHTTPAHMSASHPSHIVSPNPTHVANAHKYNMEATPGYGPESDTQESRDTHHERHNGVPVWIIE